MKRILSIILVLTLIVSAFTACGNKETNTEVGDSKGQETKKEPEVDEIKKDDPFAKHMEISLAIWGCGKIEDESDENDEVLKKFENDFNITVKPVNVTWDDWNEKLQLWGASGELPDIFATDMVTGYTETYEKWVDEEIIQPLPDNMSKYPNIEKVLQLPDIQALKKDGKHYYIPRLTYPSNDLWALDKGILIRKDWREQFGLKKPETFEEFYNVMKAFVEKDPDGNGKNDTIGIATNAQSLLNAVFLSSCPEVTNEGWVKEDGKWIPAYTSKKMDDGILQLKKLYSEKLLDQDFAIIKGNDGIEKFAQGIAGGVFFQVTPATLNTLENLWNKYDHDEKFEDVYEITPFWETKNGEMYRFIQTTFWSETYINGDVDSEKMDRILRLFDWLYSEKGLEFIQYGVEGIDYKKDGDKIVITREKDSKTGKYINLTEKYPSYETFKILGQWAQQTAYVDNEINRMTFGEVNLKNSLDFLDWSLKNAKPVPTNWEIKLMSTPAKNKLSAIRFMDDVTKVILSDEDPIKMWHEIVKSYDAKGMQEAIKEVNEKVKELGIE